MTARLLARGLTAAAVLWLAALLSVPFISRHPDGAVAAALVRAAGSLVCHQRPERSFTIDGVRLPVCARCTGLYAAGAVAALAGLFGGAGGVGRPRLVLGAAAAPMAVTVALEWTGIAGMSNGVRFLSALPLGTAAGWLFVRMLRAEGAARQMGYHARV